VEVAEVAYEVLMRKPGLNTKLEESWEGPYTVKKRNSPLSYTINVGSRVIQSVHIQLLKQYMSENETLRIERATMVLELDVEGDDITNRYTETVIGGDALTTEQQKDIEEICEEFNPFNTGINFENKKTTFGKE